MARLGAHDLRSIAHTCGTCDTYGTCGAYSRWLEVWRRRVRVVWAVPFSGRAWGGRQSSALIVAAALRSLLPALLSPNTSTVLFWLPHVCECAPY